ncbi:SIMPL domain-containing protein [Nocardioides zeae]|uniref:SIMPL domain-containing protein n=1 Tax=Nocardioides zeae TaxID=1457234 RepID=A0A6P0HL27_9ACTN|nr:SIMPL domain-containing protein [Nocardioides zeae]
MSEVEITVAGQARVTVAPDQGSIRGQVVIDGDDAHDVLQRVTTSVRALVEDLRALADAPGTALSSWSVDDAVSGVRQDWTAEGTPRTVRYAAASVRAAFTDARALGAWVTAASGVPGLAVHDVRWSLLPEHEAEVRAGLCRDAVVDAARRAGEYAAAAGLAPPRWVALADEGMLHGRSDTVFAAMSGAPRHEVHHLGGGEALPFQPEPLLLTATVHGRFAASPRPHAAPEPSPHPSPHPEES